MDFSRVELSDDDRAFQDELRAFLTTVVTDEVIARDRQTGENFDEGVHLALGEAGYLAADFKDQADAFRTYSEAAKRYRDVVEKAGADVFISSHIAQDRIPDKINALKFRQPGEPHPFVSKEAPLNHLTVVGECAAARLAGETKNEVSKIQ